MKDRDRTKEAGEHAGDSLPRWYAVHTRSRHEKLVARQFSQKQLEAFLPLHVEAHRWKDRYKKVEVPLFSGYVFVQFERASQRRQAVLRTPGVIRIVGFGQRDEPVPDEQIEALRRVVESEVHAEKHKYLRVGQRVKVISGALAGVEGILKRVKGNARLVIAVGAIRQAVAIELEGYEVVAVR
ncbi:MAG: UpxY family transcription antiterminator [Acidobacteria bacterium]|nr:UpxY family transcription antiterminator [Acidobacteriota bacterium]MCL5287196.1 UpxY family transcription antiterminator [Acidobacteriota bacterium]